MATVPKSCIHMPKPFFKCLGPLMAVLAKELIIFIIFHRFQKSVFFILKKHFWLEDTHCVEKKPSSLLACQDCLAGWRLWQWVTSSEPSNRNFIADGLGGFLLVASGTAYDYLTHAAILHFVCAAHRKVTLKKNCQNFVSVSGSPTTVLGFPSGIIR